MSDVQAYSPGSTGTLSDVLERGPELAPFTPAGPDGFKSAPSLGDMFSAARPEALRSTPGYDDSKVQEGYAPILDELGLPASENPANFPDPQGDAAYALVQHRPSSLATAAGQGETIPFSSSRWADRPLQEALVAQQIHARRAKDPNFAPGVPDTVEGLNAYFEQQQAAKRAAGAAVLARGGTVGRAAAGIAAGFAESATHDPSFIPTLLVGGGTASGVIQAVGRDALINGVLSAAQLPTEAHNMAENGEELTAGDAVTQVVEGAVAGGIFGGVVHGAVHVAPVLTETLFKAMPESVQTRWAGKMKVGGVPLADVLHDMDNRELATFSRSTIGGHMTPDEKAAADTLERSQELGEASPFAPGPVGDAAHNASLADALKRMVDRSSGSTDADLLASSSTVSLRSPAPVAVPEDPGFGAQWSAIRGNEHGIGSHGEFLTSKKGAIGPAQVMPGTAPYAAKLAGLPWDEVRYRSDAGYNEAIGRAYYAEQLKTFGDPDMAAAAYNAGPGSAARGTGLRGAMRKAAEHGEPENWEAFLPRETQRYVEDFRRRTGRAGAEAPVVAAGAGDGLSGEADAAEGEALALSRERELADAADLARDRADVADVPVLKRELFPDDASYADAQAAFHQSLNAPEEAARTPLSAETDVGGQSQPGPETAPGAAGEAPTSDAPTVTYHIVDTHAGNEVVAATDTFGEALAKQRALNADAEARNGVPRFLVGKVEAAPATGPLTRAEIEALRPADNSRDALWLAGHQIVTSAELGREAAPIWGVRDPESGELVSWAMNKRAAESARADQWNPERLQVEKLTPDEITAELRDRLAAQRTPASVDVRIDEPALKAFDRPAGEGAKDQLGSLEHDYRTAAADPELAKRAYQLEDAGKPQTIADVLEEIDRDRAAAAALRACAEGNG